MDEPYAALRPKAFAIAYRMLGSAAEAEDVVQEAFLRVHASWRPARPSPRSRRSSMTVVTRLAIDELRSARARRERYVGEWLPEPIVTDGDDDPAAHAELSESLGLAFLVLLESLSPEQRAVYLLHDVFDYGYDEIAAILGKAPPAVRQLAVRARRHVDERRPRFESSPEQRERLAQRFFAAVEQGDVQGLEALLAQDVVLHGDGGGKVPALARPPSGRARVARTLLAWARAGARLGGVTLRRVDVNGQPGSLALDRDGHVLSVLALEVRAGEVHAVRSVVNPDKLRHLGPVGDYGALLEAARRAD